jgi:hypothetical protein
MIAGEKGAVCYFFPYEAMKRLSFDEILKIK